MDTPFTWGSIPRKWKKQWRLAHFLYGDGWGRSFKSIASPKNGPGNIHTVVVVVVVVGSWLLVLGCWFLVVGCWLLVVCCLLFAVCCLLFVVGCLLFVVCCLLFVLPASLRTNRTYLHALSCHTCWMLRNCTYMFHATQLHVLVLFV